MPTLNFNDSEVVVEGLITANGAGTYTLTLPVPALASVRDVQVSNDALWDNASSAAMDVGDSDDTDGYFAALDLTSAPVADTVDGGGLSNLLSSTGSGTYAGFTKRYAVAANIVAVVTAVGAGAAGRTRVRVIYTLPTTVIAAVKT